MFGYVLPNKPDLTLREYALWRAHYCGLCKRTGKEYGQLPRLATNYDAAFLSLFMHDFHDIKSPLYMSRCPFHPFQKLAVLQETPLSKKLGAANILLSYYKAKDGVADGGGAGSRLAAQRLKRARKRAMKALPGADEIIKNNYARLAALENSGCKSADGAADCFASLLRDLALLLGEGAERCKDPAQTENLGNFFYHLGRFVYLADALDDLNEDAAAGRYNPLIAEYSPSKDIKNFNRKAFVAEHREDLEYSLYGSVRQMQETLEKFNFRMSNNLLQNVVFCGIPNMAEKLLNAERKLEQEKM